MNTYLYLYNGDRLENIRADDQQNGKWDIEFSIDEGKLYFFYHLLCLKIISIQDQSEGSSIFTIDNSEAFGVSTGRLQLSQLPSDYEGVYKVQ